MESEKSRRRTEKAATEAEPAPLVQVLARAFWACKLTYAAQFGLSASEVWILALLVRQDGMTQYELTSVIRCDPSLITRMIQDLEREHGWIRRERDARDNRLVRVYLTAEGRVQARMLAERDAILEQRLTKDFSADQLESLRAMLQSLEQTARADLAAQPSTSSAIIPRAKGSTV